MEQLAVPREPASGVTIDQADGKITITITTSPPSDKRPTDNGKNACALWYEAYARLRAENLKELETFEDQARNVFRPLERSSSSSVIGRSAAPGWHNMRPSTVLGAINLWISDTDVDEELDDAPNDKPVAESDKSQKTEVENLRRVLLSIKSLLRQSIHDSPSAHLTWVAACLCIQGLFSEKRPLSEMTGLAYIVSRISFYDRLACLVPNGTYEITAKEVSDENGEDQEENDENDENNDKYEKDKDGEAIKEAEDKNKDSPFRAALVNLYMAVFKHLIVTVALGSVTPKSSAQQREDMAWNGPGEDRAGIPLVIALESSLGSHKVLEEKIKELVRLRALPLAPLGRRDIAEKAAGDPEIDTLEKDSAFKTDSVDGNGEDEVDDNEKGDNNNNNGSRLHDAQSLAPRTNILSISRLNSISVNAPTAHSHQEALPGPQEIQKLLCIAPLPPPPWPLGPQQSFTHSSEMLKDMHGWVLEQAAYKRWFKARSTEDTDSKHRILWVRGPEGSCMTMVLEALVSEGGKICAQDRVEQPARHIVAHSFWDWSRDAHGTSVVSVLRDLVWNLLTAQPKLQHHLTDAIESMDRSPYLGGGKSSVQNNDNESENYDEGRARDKTSHKIKIDPGTEARYAALGTSHSFYSMLVLLCRIVSDPTFAATCFVVDHVDHLDGLLGDESGTTHNDGKSGPSRTALKRAWTLRDLFALMHTTCRLSGKVTWIVASSSSTLISGGCCLDLTPEDPTLIKITRLYVRQLLLTRPTRYSSNLLEQLEVAVARGSGGNFSWIYVVVELLNKEPLPWNAAALLDRILRIKAGLVPLLDYTVKSTGFDKDHVSAILSVAACTFQPLTVVELGTLAELPTTVDLNMIITTLIGQLLEIREIKVDDYEQRKCVYFKSQAVLSAQHVRLARDAAVPNPDAKLHADMAHRHVRCLVRHYANSPSRTNRSDGKHIAETGHEQLSLYMKFAWLRHLDRVDLEDPGDLLSKDVCIFAEQFAGMWLCDLEALDALAVAQCLLQDLLVPFSQPLLPIQSALKTIFVSIVSQKITDMPLVDTDRFFRLAGHNHKILNEKTSTGSDMLSVLPQDPPIMLHSMPSVQGKEMTASEAHVGTLKAHQDWVRDTSWAFSSRLLVTISDDGNIHCWDRASLQKQHIVSHQLPTYPTQLSVHSDSVIMVASDYNDLVSFDLTAGAVSISQNSLQNVVKEMREHLRQNRAKAENCKDIEDDEYALGDDGDEPDRRLSFNEVRFAEDGSNDVVVAYTVGHSTTDKAYEILVSTPKLRFKEVRHSSHGYKSLSKNLQEKLPKSECNFVQVVPSLGLAVVLQTSGDVTIYDTQSATRLHTLQCSQGKYTGLGYDMLEHTFYTKDENGYLALHVVQDRENQIQGEGKEDMKPLIRSYEIPRTHSVQSSISYTFNHDQYEIALSFRSNSVLVYKVAEIDTNAANFITSDDVCSAQPTSDDSRVGDSSKSTQSQFASTLLSHDGFQAATANKDNEIQLWDLNIAPIGVSGASSPTLLCTINSVESEPNWLSYSNDDTLLLSCHDDFSAYVWDTKTGACVAILGGHTSYVHFATFSPGDKLVATISYDDIRLWDLAACRSLFLEKNGDVKASFEEHDHASDDDNKKSGSSSGIVSGIGDSSAHGDDNDNENEINENNEKNIETSGNGNDNDDDNDNNEVSNNIDNNSNDSGHGDDNGDSDNNRNDDSKNGSNDNDGKTTGTTNPVFVSIKNAIPIAGGMVAFSPDGRFLAGTGFLGHVWDISPALDRVLPKGPLTSCATLSLSAPVKHKQAKERHHSHDGDSIGDNDENADDNDDDDGGDDSSSDSFSLSSSSLVFSPDSRSLFGFCDDGQLLVWAYTSPSSSSSDGHDNRDDSEGQWQPQATVLAHGFEIPDDRSPWAFTPRRLLVSGTEGHYLLHSEIGVWELPSSPWPGNAGGTESKAQKVGLRSSPNHPCTIILTESRKSILWQGQILSMIPQIYEPYMEYFFSSFTCGVHDGKSLLLGSKSGHLIYFRFRAQNPKTEGVGEPQDGGGLENRDSEPNKAVERIEAAEEQT